VQLETDGLGIALQQLAASSSVRARVDCRVDCQHTVFVRQNAVATHLYRIAQEAVTNAIKHSHARTISIGLGAVEDEVTLTVKDDGIGFPESIDRPQGMGLHIMNYRARMIGAAFDIRRGARGGTIVICSFRNHNQLEDTHVHSSKT
jgi:two-component system, LuxR family, sensor kinase FixL